MGIKIFKFLLIVAAVVVSSGCRNVLKETAKADTTNAKFYEAKLLMNERDYAGAITILQSLGPTFLSQRHVAVVYASAFSGRCGLDFVNLIDSLANVSAAASMFVFLMQHFVAGTDAKIIDCVFSESILNGIGDFTQRIPDENILMGMSSLTKVGTVLSRWADTDSDGVADAGFDHCDLTDFPDDAVREIGTGIAQAILSITAVAADITSDTLTEITSICALDPNLNVFCTTTDKNTYTANEVNVLRAILGSTDEGIGACAGGFVGCICP